VITTTEEALRAIGATPDVLTQEEYDHLDAQGFLILRDVVDEEWLAGIRRRIAELLEIEGADAGREVPKQEGVDMLGDLFSKGEVFLRMLREPRVLAAAAHALEQDIKVAAINFRAARPGDGNQALHSDYGSLRADGGFKLCNSMWLLDDFTLENGGTRIVAGTHIGGRLPEHELDDPQAPHPEQIVVEERAGTVVVFNGHTWHGGTLNTTERARRGITLAYTRRDEQQQYDLRTNFRADVRETLSPAERFLLDV
jgi:ectoine hydroxylase-related dioxygenase (phytanoyl-CoA dioxygenase family)